MVFSFTRAVPLFCILQLVKNMLLQLDGSQFPSPPGLDAPFSRNIEEGSPRVGLISTHSPEASSGVKTSGTGHRPAASYSNARKRAYRRARRRAEISGGTIYRGGWRTAHGLQTTYRGCTLPVVRPVVAQSRQRPAHRLRVMTYNIGGFSGETYAVFCRWLTTQIDIIMVQETHWGLGRNEGRWQVGSWTVVSPDPQCRYAGVATFCLKPHCRGCSDRLQYMLAWTHPPRQV